MGRTLALAFCLLAAALIAWLGEQPPRPSLATSPADAFHAGLAFRDVQVIARAPHPAGSAANAAVRDHLFQRMALLGLAPRLRVDDVFAVHGTTVLGGRAETLVGVLPGRDRALPAVAVMAHYDSEVASPGAADDAAGVAAALETVRALRAAGTRRRDLIVILTDAEEAGLLGARGVFAGDPLARRIGFLVNLEARGGGGRARMFETGPGNGQSVALFARAVAAPSASSLAVFLYAVAPNDTDFSVARAAGIPGLNFAFIGGQADYHAASSTPAALDQGSLQDLGEQLLAVTRRAADAAVLPRPDRDVAFHQLPGGGPLVAYPAAWGWGLIAAAAGLLALALRRAASAAAVAPADVLRGAGAGLFLLVGAASVLHAARVGAGAGFGFLGQQRLLAQAGRYEAALLLLALGLLLYTAAELARGRRGIALVAAAAAVAGAVAGGFAPFSLGLGAAALALALIVFRRPASVAAAWLGLLLLLLAAAVAIQALAAPAAVVAAWPLLLGSALAALSGLGTQRSWPVRLATAAGAVLGLAWLGGIAHGVFLGLDRPELLAPLVPLAAALVWPLAQPEADGAGTPFVAVAVLLAGAALLAIVRLDPPWSARHPRPARVVYQQDLATGRAWRLDDVPEPSAWGRAVLRADGGAIGARPAPPMFDSPVAAAPARPIAAIAPALSLRAAADGGFVLAARPPAGASNLVLDVTSARPLREVTLAGRPLRLFDRPGQTVRIRWRPAADGFDLGFRADAPGGLDIRYAALVPAWPAAAAPLPPRPDDVAPFGVSDSTLVTGARRLTWPPTSANKVP